ncbi:toxin ParE1/3/4 [Parabacteroides sp. PFB2-12]|uniref:type II toxin-antitoxin system RelE/ParE family toxin n=1 Tax=unclassified Parabacteroides TaxID=2649774 RepID=UPI0024755B5D|nr:MULTISPECIES: type II toxin-antitoxin system RelE/ParE family toxin [unclassified Parabacteroides]MDH6342122.1 toxin ParE1/3/4 [Parabacteroides sp. PM6-13]MDH6389541.1 toxin ParE1/3/4 [Parabacteroides sp. PFB2-12]
MVVYWESEALDNLKDIFLYHRKNAGTRIARKIRDEIKLTADKLGRFPSLGMIVEETGSHITYRSILAYKHYKLYYHTNNTGVFISAVWDTRQDPLKLEQFLEQ